MKWRTELAPLLLGIIMATYLIKYIPTGKVIFLIPYSLLILTAIRRKSLPFGASALFSLAFLEWILSDNYLAIAVMLLTLLETPIRIEKQSVKFWERVLNVVVAGITAYVALVSPDPSIKAVGVLATIGMVSSNRSISSGALLTASAMFTAIALRGISDMNPIIFLTTSGALILYSLHHLRKLLR